MDGLSHQRGGRDASQRSRGGEISNLTPFDTSGISHQLYIAASVICWRRYHPKYMGMSVRPVADAD